MTLLRLRPGLLLAVLFLCAPPVPADEPPEEVPAPRPVPTPVEVLPPRPLLPLAGYQPPVAPEFGRQSVWGFYGVTRTGRFRPLVVQTPYGAYYRYSGAPFPWANNQTNPYMPHVLSAPYMPYARD
jgi:hypothetical protein